MAAITVNIDDTIYQQALALFAFKGISAEAAVKELFERAAYDEYPRYEQLEPNAETIAAMQECEDILDGKIETKSYTDVDEMFSDIINGEDDG